MIATGAPYRHDEHGRVEPLVVRDGVVYFETIGATISGTGIPASGREPVSVFAANATPADQCIGATTETLHPDPDS
jgi:hypothetical protein